MNLYETAKLMVTGDPSAKSLDYYKHYEEFFLRHELIPRRILEIGTFKGESTKIFSKAFPESLVLTLDIELREIDFSGCQNVKYLQCDQCDREALLSALRTAEFEPVDLIIDDASHIGAFSQMTFDTLFPLLKSGGAYFVEDWGTGYWDSWIDGVFCDNYSEGPAVGKRIRSHDFGMVGFVKSLVDFTHEVAIRRLQSDNPTRRSRIRSLEFREGVCMALKS